MWQFASCSYCCTQPELSLLTLYHDGSEQEVALAFTCKMVSKLKVRPFHSVNSPLEAPVTRRLPSGVHWIKTRHRVSTCLIVPIRVKSFQRTVSVITRGQRKETKHSVRSPELFRPIPGSKQKAQTALWWTGNDSRAHPDHKDWTLDFVGGCPDKLCGDSIHRIVEHSQRRDKLWGRHKEGVERTLGGGGGICDDRSVILCSCYWLVCVQWCVHWQHVLVNTNIIVESSVWLDGSKVPMVSLPKSVLHRQIKVIGHLISQWYHWVPMLGLTSRYLMTEGL